MTEAQDLPLSRPGPSNGSADPDGEPSTSDTDGSTFEFPNEIQKLIFEHAAILDGKCAFRLCQVAKYINIWIHPILYRRVSLRGTQSAISFINTLRSKPQESFKRFIRSLTISGTVTLPQAKEILVECSRHVLVLTIFRKGDTEEKVLEYAKAPHLRRLTMVCHCDWDRNYRWNRANTQYHIPSSILSTLTHLTIVADYDSGYWIDLVQASVALKYHNNAEYASSYLAFQNLTHMATSVYGLQLNWMVCKVAKKLRYFAILESANYSDAEHEKLMESVRAQDERGKAKDLVVPRSIVILKDLGDPECWKAEDSFRPSTFWRKVETLVDEGYISDRGERW